jgi:hypothetical protein
MEKYGGAGVTELPFLTMALDEGEWSTFDAPTPPPPGKSARYSVYKRLLGPKQVWNLWRR